MAANKLKVKQDKNKTIVFSSNKLKSLVKFRANVIQQKKMLDI